MLTNQKQVRFAFWAAHPDLKCVKVNGKPVREFQQPSETRSAFGDYINYLHNDGQISETLAAQATL